MQRLRELLVWFKSTCRLESEQLIVQVYSSRVCLVLIQFICSLCADVIGMFYPTRIANIDALTPKSAGAKRVSGA